MNYIYIYIWMFPKILVPQNGWFLNNGKPYEQMDDLGVYTTIFGNTYILEVVIPQIFSLLPHKRWRFWGVVECSNVISMAEDVEVLRRPDFYNFYPNKN